MFAEPFWAALLSRLKIDSSEWVDPTILLFSTLWFQLLCAMMVGAAIGAWLHWAAIAYDGRAPQRDRALCDFLLPRIDSIIENLERISFTPKPLDGSAIAPLTVVPEIQSAYNILEGNGFRIPEIPSNYRGAYLAQNTVYFRSIRPFIANYQIAMAKSTAKTCSEVSAERFNQIKSQP
jgi:hypothetical protein